MRKYLVAGLAVALILMGGLFALLGPRPCPVNREAFGRIEEGMTQAEVEAILGGPPGDYRCPPLHPDEPPWPIISLCKIRTRWRGYEGTVTVTYYLADGLVLRVGSTAFEEAESDCTGPLGPARWRLGKLGEAWLP